MVAKREEMVPEWFYKKDEESKRKPQRNRQRKIQISKQRRRKLREELQQMNKGVK